MPEKNAVVIFNTLTKNIASVDQDLIDSLRQSEFLRLSKEELLNLKDTKIIVEHQFNEIAYLKYLLGKVKYTKKSLGMFISLTTDYLRT